MRPLGGADLLIIAIFCIGALAVPLIVLYVLQAQKNRRVLSREQFLERRVSELQAENRQMREQLHGSEHVCEE